MRLLLLIGLLLLLVPAARAQDSLSVARPAALAPVGIPAAAATDTLAALHRLFAHKRAIRTRLVLATLGTDAALIGITLAANNNGSYTPLVAIAVGIVVIPFVLPELLYYSQYSRRHERLAIQDLQAHRLAASLKQRLDARYFQPPTP